MNKSKETSRLTWVLPAIAIVFAMVVVAVSLPADQADADSPTSGTCGDGVVWSFDSASGTLSVTYTGSGTGKMADIDDPNKSEYAYLYKNIDNIVIGEGVTYVGKMAFCGFEAKTITLPSTVVELGESCFEKNKITSIDLKNVVTIRKQALDYTDITSVVIPSTVKIIDDYAFDECQHLAVVDTSGATSLEKIGHAAFVTSAITSFYVPATVTSLGTGIFVECFNLTSIDVDDANPNYVDVDGVVYTPDMKTVLMYPSARACESYVIPDTVTTIATAAFATGYKIGAITIPETITEIPEAAFQKCTALKTIKIPNTVTSIGGFAFTDCLGIENIDFSGTTVLKSIGNGAFLGNEKLKTVEIPACVTFVGERVFAYCSALESISIDSSNQYYTTVDGVLYDKKMETLMQFPAASKITDFTVPSTVKTVNVNSFTNLKNLASLTFPDNVTTIGDATTSSSYGQSPLLRISIGNGLTEFTGPDPFVDHYFLDENGNKMKQTVQNLKGHTFVGTDIHHMYIDDTPRDEGFPVWAIVVVVIVALVAVVGVVMWKRSR